MSMPENTRARKDRLVRVQEGRLALAAGLDARELLSLIIKELQVVCIEVCCASLFDRPTPLGSGTGPRHGILDSRRADQPNSDPPS
jgi:hypothetical protein